MIRKNVAGQYLWGQINSRTDGSPLTSAVAFSYDAGTYGSGSGTLTHRGGGLWRYELTQAETNVDAFGYQFTHASGVAVGGTVLPQTYGGGFLSVNEAAYGGAAVAFADGTLQSTSGSVVRLAAAQPDTVQIGQELVIVGGSGVGFRGIVVAYDGATNDATLDRAATGLDNTSQYVLGALNAGRLVVEGTLDVVEVHRLILAALAGDLVRTGDGYAFRDLAGTKDRIAGTFPAGGSRTVTTRDAS